LVHRGDDVREVRVLGLPQRRRDTDVDGVEVPNDREVAGRAELAALDLLADLRVLRVDDVGAAGRDGVDLPRIEVDAGDLEAGARELERQRQADVAEAD